MNEVLTLQESDIQDTPDFGIGVETPYLLGMAKVKDSVKILLDIDEALAASDMSALGALANRSSETGRLLIHGRHGIRVSRDQPKA